MPPIRASTAAGLSNEARGIVIVLFGMALFGVMDTASKFLAAHYHPVQILWLRYLFSVPLVLVSVASRGGVRAALRVRAPWLQLARTVLLVVEMGLVVVAFHLMPLADTHAILAATPLMVTALAVPVLGERVGLRRWIAVLVGFLGVLLIVRPGIGTIAPGALVALGCTLLYAIYQLLTRRVGGYDTVETSLLFQFGVGAILLTCIGPFFWEMPPPRHWPFFLALAVLGSIGHYCVIRALQLAPAVVIQPFSYTMLIWAVTLGWLVFGDWPDLWTIGGALVIVGAGSYAAWRQHRLSAAR
jgi:drug/metabolite transporter (DMT)-like permease